MYHLHVGERIGGYLVERIVHRGESATVYAARDEANRKVAIRVMPDATPAFLLEANRAQAVKHPALVAILGAGTLEDQAYVVYEWVDGSPIKAKDEADALRLTTEILTAVAKLHATGIAHLALRYTNVVAANGRVKILDLGTSQLIDEEPDMRDDVYAIGVIMLGLVVGEQRDSSAMKLAPMRLRPLMQRAMAHDRNLRFKDASAMLAAVQGLGAPVKKKRTALIATVGAAAAVAVAVPVTIARWDRPTAVDPGTLGERVTRDALAIEARMRTARLAPLHDLRPEVAQAEIDVALLSAEASNIPAAQVALARAERAVHDLAGARERLEHVETPEAKRALGDIVLDQYNEAQTNLWYVTDIAHVQQQATTLRDEGLKGLVDSKPTDPLTLARIAIFEGRLPEGERLAADALLTDANLFEAHYVLGEAYVAAGDFEKARHELEAGSAIAPSAPELHEGLCRALQLQLDARQYAAEAAAIYTDARAACARALVVRPGDLVATVVIAHLDQVRAAGVMERGGDPQSVLQDGFALLGAALAVDPNNFSLLDARGTLSLMAANADVQRDRDPRPNLTVAEQSFAATDAVQPNSHTEDMLGQIAAMRAEDTLGRGGDPRMFVRHAVELLQHSDSPHREVFAGRALVARATYETQHDLDPHEALDAAIAAFQKARIASPKNMAAADEEGGAWQAKAEWERKQGIDNIASLDRAIACSETVLANDADDLEGHANIGGVLIMRAEAELAKKGDARPYLEQAIKHLDRAHQIDKSAVSVKTSIASAQKLLAQLSK